MSIFHLTDVAFVGSFIFTLSTLTSARQARLGKRRAFRDPGHPRPLTGFARGRFFTLKSRPQHREPYIGCSELTGSLNLMHGLVRFIRCTELNDPLNLTHGIWWKNGLNIFLSLEIPSWTTH